MIIINKFSDIIDFADTCIYCNWNKSHNGNCDRNGYAPFDCRTCSSYKRKENDVNKNGN